MIFVIVAARISVESRGIQSQVVCFDAILKDGEQWRAEYLFESTGDEIFRCLVGRVARILWRIAQRPLTILILNELLGTWMDGWVNG